MASSHAIAATTILSLLLLASSHSLVQAARMMPSDRRASSTDHSASSSTSRALLQEFMAPPRPHEAIASKPEIVGAWRRRVIEVQGTCYVSLIWAAGLLVSEVRSLGCSEEEWVASWSTRASWTPRAVRAGWKQRRMVRILLVREQGI
ncbi:hypothetical protein ABZP36_012929 [Zizania latifolia]